MPARRPIAWVPLIGAMVVGGALTGIVGWRLNVRGIEERIADRRAALKKLVLSGRIPPNEEVVAYLTSRETALERRYHNWLAMVASPPLAEAAAADPQLYFQEQFHEVQRTLERLAAARSVAVPEQLGFPKELPPSDMVPRLLVQLLLIKETAALIFEQGVTSVSSFKVEDPQPVPSEAGEATFLMRLPVRVRLSATLPQLMKVMMAIQRTSPVVDVVAVRILTPAARQPATPPSSTLPATQKESVGLMAQTGLSSGTGQATVAKVGAAQAGAMDAGPSGNVPETLDVELLLSRYLVMAGQEPIAEENVAGTGAEVLPTKGGRGTPSATSSGLPRQAPLRPKAGAKTKSETSARHNGAEGH